MPEAPFPQLQYIQRPQRNIPYGEIVFMMTCMWFVDLIISQYGHFFCANVVFSGRRDILPVTKKLSSHFSHLWHLAATCTYGIWKPLPLAKTSVLVYQSSFTCQQPH